MNKLIQLLPRSYSDVAYVEGIMRHDERMISAFYHHCHSYFQAHKYSLSASDQDRDRIFMESFETMWENIERGRIYVEQSVLKGDDGKLFSGYLTTYLMSIARLKFLELWREPSGESLDVVENQKEFSEKPDYGDGMPRVDMYDVLSMCIAVMPERCSQILTKIYYEHKDYDVILMELPSFTSRDALKTAKNKCMNRLRQSANEIWSHYEET